MSVLGNRRTLGGVALSILLFAGLPGLAIAAQPSVGPATSKPHTSGGALLTTILFGFAAAASLTSALRRSLVSQR
jgi:hypothetical protein